MRIRQRNAYLDRDRDREPDELRRRDVVRLDVVRRLFVVRERVDPLRRPRPAREVLRPDFLLLERVRLVLPALPDVALPPRELRDRVVFFRPRLCLDDPLVARFVELDFRRDDELDDLLLSGMLTPDCRALDKPIATACLRFFTACFPLRA